MPASPVTATGASVRAGAGGPELRQESPVFKADHPAAQECRKGLLEAAGIPVPEDVVPAHLWRRDDALRPFGFFRLVRAAVTG
ncbi:hypothetical protein [Actinomadura mexicana]|uniref:Uncharacterized protein n=1 Tax=Actinomadura mexicana TaxID=134959 RepID=A0A238V294_9ACTN|nr:hypothetical protein [Actinomadura mexicana]SNR28271.1 hypothetical protein SAMN06265355_101789 [Actinomadura mexicana]